MARPRVAVAASGGRDSTALLHCTVRQGRALGVEVVALHVHHGLMPQADDWLAQVRAQSRRWGAAFDSQRLGSEPARGESIEAWAREQRYRALAEMALANDCTLVLLAHHRRDQAETWLLQALRGAGPAGLSAMPRLAQRQGIVWARPWLDQAPAAIDAYVCRHRLRHAQDPSNADPRFARSRLRHVVWPALGAAFVDAETSLAHAAARAQDAAALAHEVAAIDLPPLLGAAGLESARWQQLPPARRANAIKAWLATQLGVAAPQSLLERLLLELPRVRQGSWPAPGATLRLYRGWLSVQAAAPVPTGPPASTLDLSRPGVVDMQQWGGSWQVSIAKEGGIPAAALRQVLVRGRQGGERFRFQPAAMARSLKKQYQALAVPAWQRQGPLLFSLQGSLIFVPGLGTDAAFLARPGEAQRVLQWRAATAPATGQRQRRG